jgi:hypothetical protein
VSRCVAVDFFSLARKTSLCRSMTNESKGEEKREEKSEGEPAGRRDVSLAENSFLSLSFSLFLGSSQCDHHSLLVTITVNKILSI